MFQNVVRSGGVKDTGSDGSKNLLAGKRIWLGSADIVQGSDVHSSFLHQVRNL